MPTNLESFLLSLTDRQITQMDPSSNGQATMSVNLGSQQLPSTSKQIAQVDLLPRFHTTTPVDHGSQQLSLAERQFAQSKVQPSMAANFGPYQFLPTNNQPIQMEASPRTQTPMPVYFGLHPLPSTNRRPLDSSRSLNIQTSIPNNPGLLSPLYTNKRQVQMIPSPKLQAMTPSTMGLQQFSSTNKRPAQTELPSKSQTESLESVRSKLRESLSAALAMVSNQHNKQQVVQKTKNTEGANASTSKLAEVNSQSEASGTAPENALSGTSSEISASNEHKEKQESQIPSGGIAATEMQVLQPRHGILEDDLLLNNNTVIQDELLQGHGLCWASDATEGISSLTSKKPKLAPEEAKGDLDGELDQSSVALAIKIEAELFKLHGGVTKKYKEKGRSLLFNLKDRNNPELRERVMSGDIAPERLCSMTAEELASKELSQWRLAKAEEFAQMVVLPDSDVDIRRLVKKTHKGEFQVEVERDDNVSVEVAVGASVLTQIPAKLNEGETQAQGKPHDKTGVSASRLHEKVSEVSLLAKKADAGDQNLGTNLDILNEKPDLMQELMVDELKGAELLPPIVSLDEFMEALDSEPPFENMSMGRGEDVPNFDGKTSDSVEPQKSAALDELSPKLDTASGSLGSRLNSAETGPVSKLDTVDASLVPGNSEKADSKDPDINGETKSNSMHDGSEAIPSRTATKVDNIWEGLIQLATSSLVTVVGFFTSGEKTSTREWPNILEIKGRVRLDAFEKFLQDLPLSRSRAVMIVQFCWKEGSPENGRVNLSETVDSYIADGRLGFAEPAPGVELYFCPPHKRTTEMLAKHLSKEHVETLNSADDVLIGVVVWRKSHVTISPRVSSHNKNNSTKRQLSSRKHQNVKPTLNSKNSQPPPPIAHTSLPSDDETMDDVPPGFGPDARDEDDLPEFDFSHGNSQASVRNASHSSGLGIAGKHPADQMRALVHKYGQSETSKKPILEIQPWNNDEDEDEDDIPEWQPPQESQPHHALPQSLPPPPPQAAAAAAAVPAPPTTQLHAYQTLNSQPALFNQQMMQVTPQQQLSQPQQLVQFAAAMPMQLQPPLQSQMGLGYMQQVQQNVQPGWQSAQWWPPAPGPADTGPPMNGQMQPAQYVAQPGDGQFYGMQGYGTAHNGAGWRHR